MMAQWLKCDQCVAQALWEAKKDEMSLYFCGHHMDSQGDRLVNWANEMIELLNYEQDLIEVK
jgi:hypothetical protein